MLNTERRCRNMSWPLSVPQLHIVESRQQFATAEASAGPEALQCWFDRQPRLLAPPSSLSVGLSGLVSRTTKPNRRMQKLEPSSLDSVLCGSCSMLVHLWTGVGTNLNISRTHEAQRNGAIHQTVTMAADSRRTEIGSLWGINQSEVL